MRKIILLVIMIFFSGILLIGCSAEKSKDKKDEIVEFSEDDFIKGILKSYEKGSELEVEGRYAIGYMYSEAFSTDESGTLVNGSLHLNGRAFDPADIGDETVQNGRTYSKTANRSGNLDLELSSGSIIRGFYSNYFIPLENDWSSYDYEEIDDENGRIILENTSKKVDGENGKSIFIHEYLYIVFEGKKKDLSIDSGMIRKLIIKSYVDISSEMDDFIKTDFGNRFVLADEFNQTLGNDFLKGIYSLEEFKADFK